MNPHTMDNHSVPGPVCTSCTWLRIDALTRQSCLWKWQTTRPPAANKTKNPTPCHHHITTHSLPPDWPLSLQPAWACRDLVPGLSMATWRPTWKPVTCLCVSLYIQREQLSKIQFIPPAERENPPLWEEIIIHLPYCSWHSLRICIIIECTTTKRGRIALTLGFLIDNKNCIL